MSNQKTDTQSFDELSAIMDYESGELSREGIIQLFQHLVDNGHAWSLQGSYGRTAADLLRQGLITPHTPTAHVIATGATGGTHR
jgi:hypothetical protein